MSENQNTRWQPPSPEQHRNYAGMGGFYTPDGAPTVNITEDTRGVLVQVSPFGHEGPFLRMPLERWYEIKLAVSKAIDDRAATRYAHLADGVL